MSTKAIPKRSEVPAEDTWDLSDIFPTEDAWQAEFEAMKELPARAEEVAALQTQIEALTKKAADAVLVSELLHQAMAADEDGDLEGLQELLDQIEELKELLSPTEADIYEELKIA